MIQTIAVFAGVFALLLTLYVVWFISGKPNPSADYFAQVKQMVSGEIPPEDNACTYYEKAFELYVAPDDHAAELMDPVLQELLTSYALDASTGGSKQAIRQWIGQWVQANEPAWSQFVTGSRKRHYHQDYDYPMVDAIHGPWLWLYEVRISRVGLKRMAELGVWRTRLAMANGAMEAAIEDCLVLARASVHLRRRPSHFEQLLSFILSRMAHEQMLLVLREGSLPADSIARFQDELTHIYVDGFLPVHFEADQACALDAVQRVFTEEGRGGGHLVPKRFSELLDILGDTTYWKPEPVSKLQCLKIAMVHAGRDETCAKIAELFDLASISRTPYERAMGKSGTIKDRIERMDKNRYAMIWLTFPAVERGMDLAYRTEVLHEATLTVMALERWHAETGAYPEDLKAIVEAEYLAEVPADPFSSGPLVYRLTDDGYMLYSVGMNLADDGGTPGLNPEGVPKAWVDNGDMVFWPPVYVP